MQYTLLQFQSKFTVHVRDKVSFVHMYVRDEVMTVKILLGKTFSKTSVQLVLKGGVLTTL